jgi:hypothetical protein
MSRVLIIGAGDMGERFAAGLAAHPAVRELVLVDVSPELGLRAATVASAHDCIVRPVALDGRDQAGVEGLLRRERPDLIVQVAALQSPWALVGRTDPVGAAFAAAGLAARLPLQLPVLLSVMRAVREVGYEGPVANLSLPDLTHPLLARLGLAPTIGLGNVAMLLLRVRAALRAEAGPDADMPLLRLVGQHHHVYGVMQATPPADPATGPKVWLGEEATRRDELAYGAPAMAQGIRYNAITAAAALPVLLALLPGAASLRWSTPAPFGLPGGYPVRIEAGRIELDLPAGVELADCVAHCEREARHDGLDHIEADGAVHFTAETQAALASVAADLVEPLPIEDVDRRAGRILTLLAVNPPK